MKNTLLVFASVLSASLNATAARPVKSSIEDTKTDQSIAFTENKGQVYDQNRQPRPDVLFGAMAGNMAFHLRTTGVSYQLCRAESYTETEDIRTREKTKTIDQQTIYRIDLSWLNANKNFTTISGEALPGYSNYYLESCPNGALNVRTYKSVSLQNLYEGIRLHYYEKEGQLKHDYIIAPHANYRQIQIKVEGAMVSLSRDGSLILGTPLGKVQEGSPLVYQNGRQLSARWKVNGDIISFEIENYNPAFELIIDPITRVWGTYYGGSIDDYAYGCSTDATGNVYMAGRSVSAGGTLIATSGSHQQTFGGGSNDAFLVKFNSNGVRQWATYYGGTGQDGGSACATDASGNIYMAGVTTSSTGIASAGSHQQNNGGGSDAFLAKFNSSGVMQWSTYYGGNLYESGNDCSIDAAGNIFMVGMCDAGIGTVVATSGSHQQTFGGGLFDGFLVKFNSSGVRQWGTYYGDTGNDYASGCANDAFGNVYVVGGAQANTGTAFATVGSHQQGFGGGTADAYLVKFNSSGVRQWGTHYGGSGADYGNSCSVDVSGNVYITGQTSGNSTGAISTGLGHQFSYGGGATDAFVAKFNSSGVRQWGTHYGGTGDDSAIGCATDATGNVYMTGYTDSNTGTIIASSGSHQQIYGGGQKDAYLVKFDGSGVRQWGTYYGGSGGDYGRWCTTDPNGNCYMAGYAGSGNGTSIASGISHQPVYAGNNDAFIARFFDCAVLLSPAGINATLCAGTSLNFSLTVSGTTTPSYQWEGPNSFTSSAHNPVIPNVSVLASGVYTVAVNNTGCVELATVSVIVNPAPTITVNNGILCAGSSYTISPGGAASYTIQGGNAVVSPATSTSYTVIGISTAGCVSTSPATVNITVSPLPTISVSGGTTCSGQSFTLSPLGASNYTYQGGSAVVAPTSNTSYTVVGANTAGCKSTNTATAFITVNPLPQLTFNLNQSVFCADDASSALSALPAGGNFSGAGVSGSLFTPSVVAAGIASITYSYTDSNNCSNSISNSVTVSACTAIGHYGTDPVLMNVFPNPNHGEFTIELSEMAHVEISDLCGAIIFDQQLEKGKQCLKISVAPGVYLIRTGYHGSRLINKLIVE